MKPFSVPAIELARINFYRFKQKYPLSYQKLQTADDYDFAHFLKSMLINSINDTQKHNKQKENPMALTKINHYLSPNQSN